MYSFGMKVDTVFPLVDMQPLFAALTEIKANPDSIYTEHGRAFLIAKLRRELPEMKRTLKYVEEQLDQVREARRESKRRGVTPAR